MQDVSIRPATAGDIAHILRHRRAMFEDMGHAAAALDRMQADSQIYLAGAFRRNTYRGWLAETAAGRVVSGGGIVIAAGPDSLA